MTLGMAIALAFATAVLGVFGKYAMDMRRDGKYREMWSNVCWSVLPVVVVAILWAANGDAAVDTRNIGLGLVGAIAGASLLIWVGYLVQGAPAKKADAALTPGGGVTVDQSVTSHNQSGGITAHTVNSGAAPNAERK
jgi:hypothetical protein